MQTITAEFQALSDVKAITLGGSRRQTMTALDASSDIDLYIYYAEPISNETRLAIAEKFADTIEIDNPYWGSEDAWIHRATGIKIDLVYWHRDWIASELERVLKHHQASLGYTTCFWHTIKSSQLIFDPAGWFATLQTQTKISYPEPLRQNILNLNLPVLRDAIPSYIQQMETALKRQDIVSLNHRLAAFLASYFDVIFALNRVLHPGEKRLLELTPQLCEHIPPNMEMHIQASLIASAMADPVLLDHLDQMVFDLENFCTQLA